jgi:hypothetical protein
VEAAKEQVKAAKEDKKQVEQEEAEQRLKQAEALLRDARSPDHISYAPLEDSIPGAIGSIAGGFEGPTLVRVISVIDANKAVVRVTGMRPVSVSKNTAGRLRASGWLLEGEHLTVAAPTAGLVAGQPVPAEFHKTYPAWRVVEGGGDSGPLHEPFSFEPYLTK